MKLTKGEVIQVLGRAVEHVGKKLDDPYTPDQITPEEIRQIIQDILADLLQEFSD